MSLEKQIEEMLKRKELEKEEVKYYKRLLRERKAYENERNDK